LAPDELRIFSQEKDAALELALIGAFDDLAIQQ
jgi:hypothetical protein